MKGRKSKSLAVLLMCAAALSAYAGPKTKLVFSQVAEITALDPQKANDMPSFVVGNHLFENLIRIVDGKATPGIAEKWSYSADGKTLTFKLRDAVWSDGKPVMAGDFEYSIKRLLDPKTAAEYAFAAYYIVGAQDYNLGKTTDASTVGVKALDAKTLEIKLANPAPYFLTYLGSYCFAPARKDIVDKYGDSYATAADKAVYDGPFVLKEWKNEQSKLLVKNPTYWNKAAIKLDSVEILQISDPTTALSMYENGDLDFVSVPSNLFKQYEGKGAKTYYNGANDWMKVNVVPNPAKPWLSNADFRRAVAWAIDRESYVNISTKGLYSPNLRYILPLVRGVDKTYGEEYPLNFYTAKGDPAKAKAYLKKAMAALKIDDPSKISVEYLIQDLDEPRLMAETLQQQIQSVLGIKFTIKLVTRKQRAEMEQKHQYDFVYAGWMPDYDDPMTYLEIWAGGSSQNDSGYSSPEYDKMIAAAKVEKDASKRMAIMAKAEKILLEDAPMIPLQLRRTVYLASPKLLGLSRPLVGAEYDFTYASFK
jgi:oligopeptide transport system substrate-binding protein